MASKSVMTAKRLKVLAAYNDAEIMGALIQMKDDDQAKMSGYLVEIMRRLNKVDTTKVERPKTKKKLQIVTKQEQLHTVLLKIRQALDKYESDRIDHWTIDFLVGEIYENYTQADLEAQHQKLDSSGSCADQVKLLIFMEKGRMYDYLKFSEKWARNWGILCDSLDICSRTANRYIDFSRIVTAYPRILICGLSFETIMNLYKELQEHLAGAQDLAAELAAPLRGITFQCEKVKFTGDRLPRDGIPPDTLLSENADWSPGWQISDEIIESREEPEEYPESQEEYCESRDDNEYSEDADE